MRANVRAAVIAVGAAMAVSFPAASALATPDGGEVSAIKAGFEGGAEPHQDVAVMVGGVGVAFAGAAGLGLVVLRRRLRALSCPPRVGRSGVPGAAHEVAVWRIGERSGHSG
ncbi:hypothetical protein ACFTWH_06585 [Streptomyces sp. NPDC057011]|uniref:hypothetical protein n=1 Tax=unclassified Streptomyces TaxID=2593676 RepID=UPI0036322D5A